MCTTFLATEIIRELTGDYDLIGYPRLVRLNPNIPWKTRGNGAIAIPVGKGRGPSRILGELDGRPVRSYFRGAGVRDAQDVGHNLARCVERLAPLAEPTTNAC